MSSPARTVSWAESSAVIVSSPRWKRLETECSSRTLKVDSNASRTVRWGLRS